MDLKDRLQAINSKGVQSGLGLKTCVKVDTLFLEFWALFHPVWAILKLNNTLFQAERLLPHCHVPDWMCSYYKPFNHSRPPFNRMDPLSSKNFLFINRGGKAMLASVVSWGPGRSSIWGQVCHGWCQFLKGPMTCFQYHKFCALVYYVFANLCVSQNWQVHNRSVLNELGIIMAWMSNCLFK